MEACESRNLFAASVMGVENQPASVFQGRID